MRVGVFAAGDGDGDEVAVQAGVAEHVDDGCSDAGCVDDESAVALQVRFL